MMKPYLSEPTERAQQGHFLEMDVQQMVVCAFCSKRVIEYKDPHLHRVTCGGFCHHLQAKINKIVAHNGNTSWWKHKKISRQEGNTQQKKRISTVPQHKDQQHVHKEGDMQHDT
jgi:hypothetical protein